MLQRFECLTHSYIAGKGNHFDTLKNEEKFGCKNLDNNGPNTFI